MDPLYDVAFSVYAILSLENYIFFILGLIPTWVYFYVHVTPPIVWVAHVVKATDCRSVYKTQASRRVGSSHWKCWNWSHVYSKGKQKFTFHIYACRRVDRLLWLLLASSMLRKIRLVPSIKKKETNVFFFYVSTSGAHLETFSQTKGGKCALHLTLLLFLMVWCNK